MNAKRSMTVLFALLLLTKFSYSQDLADSPNSKLLSFFEDISVTLKTGTPSYAIGNNGQIDNEEFNLRLAEAGISYRLNTNLSVGASFVGGLGSCIEGYSTEGGMYFDDDDDDDDDDFEGDHEDDDDGEDDEDCESDEMNAFMGTVSYTVSESLPIFIQGAIGYAPEQQSPAYSILVGYHQKVFSSLGVSGGVRFGEILSGSNNDGSRGGFKAEIGVHWNF